MLLPNPCYKLLGKLKLWRKFSQPRFFLDFIDPNNSMTVPPNLDPSNLSDIPPENSPENSSEITEETPLETPLEITQELNDPETFSLTSPEIIPSNLDPSKPSDILLENSLENFLEITEENSLETPPELTQDLNYPETFSLASPEELALSPLPNDPEDDDFPDEVEMSIFDHLEELRQRIFYSLITVAISALGCFFVIKPIVSLLEIPAKGAKFIQLTPGEFFFVSMKIAGYCGLLLGSPIILYHITRFILPGLTRKERRLLLPIFLGSSILFFVGLLFAYWVLTPAALTFFMNYGEDVVESLWSIEKYFEFILVLMFCTGLAFQVPIVQVILSLFGIVSSAKMLSGWRYIVVGSLVLGAIVTPSTDPFTQSLLAGAVLGLYFSGIGVVKFLGR